VIPYFPLPVWRLGPLSIHAFGAAAALAVVTGYLVAVWRARAMRLDAGLTGRMYIVGALGGLLVGHLVAVATAGAVQSAAGLAIGSLAVAAGFLWKRGRAALPHLDALALAFPLAWALARAGCFMAHDHVGPPSALFLAVRFPGGSRLDLGLIECLAALATAALLWLLTRTRPAPGILFAFLLIAAGFTRAGIRALER
jgi:phosphatidylglycerol:prolipoprotein diacylglycerol transferase